jgi:hypothetical protein
MVSPPLVLARVSQTIDSLGLGFHLFPFAYLKSGSVPSPESRQGRYSFPAGAKCFINQWCHLNLSFMMFNL